MSGAAAVAARRVAGSGTKTKVPGGPSSSSPSTMKRAWPCEDEVELLVVARTGAELVVLLDHLAARLARGVGVDAEGADPERDPHRDRDGVAVEALELVQVGGAVAGAAHAVTATASRTRRPSLAMPSSISAGVA